jgi:hypothetical protein
MASDIRVIEQSTQIIDAPGGSIFVVLGAMLTVGIPLASIGPSFLIWPSPSEISGLILFSVAAIAIAARPHDIPSIAGSSAAVALLYVLAATLVSTVINSYPPHYSGWALTRFVQWTALIVCLFYVFEDSVLRALGHGILFGALLSGASAVLEIAGFSISYELVSRLDQSRAGPWAVIVDAPFDVFVRGASGLFSFSRTATGYFLALSAAIAVCLIRSRIYLAFYLLVVGLGILATGSRLGFLSFVVILGAKFLHQRAFLLRGALVLSLVLVAGSFMAIIEPEWLDSALVERIVGRGDDNYAEGADGRWERQRLIFDLSTIELIFGTGAGNLGFALNLDREGLNFYGAHGFLFQYVASVGLLGTTLFFLCAASSFFYVRTTPLRLGLVVTLILCAISEDFFFPNAPGGHMPVFFFIAFRLARPLSSDG